MHNEDEKHTLYSNFHHSYKDRVAAYNDAQARSAQAEELNPEFFLSDEHNTAVDATIDLVNVILNAERPQYQNSRGIGRQKNKPFTALKWQGAGPILSKKSRSWKEDNLYSPLRALGVTSAKCNLKGEFVVRVYNGPKRKAS